MDNFTNAFPDDLPAGWTNPNALQAFVGIRDVTVHTAHLLNDPTVPWKTWVTASSIEIAQQPRPDHERFYSGQTVFGWGTPISGTVLVVPDTPVQAGGWLSDFYLYTTVSPRTLRHWNGEIIPLVDVPRIVAELERFVRVLKEQLHYSTQESRV